jgi:hypothetical protein
MLVTSPPHVGDAATLYGPGSDAGLRAAPVIDVSLRLVVPSLGWSAGAVRPW